PRGRGQIGMQTLPYWAAMERIVLARAARWPPRTSYPVLWQQDGGLGLNGRRRRNSMIDIHRTRPKTKAEQESEVERVYRTLKSWLIEARLPPGDFLSEVDLASRCKTSRTPIREAFSRLAQDGWLTRIRRKRYLVTPISIRDIVELYEYRRILECFVVDKLAQSASHEQM